jgi:hypothetical protein
MFEFLLVDVEIRLIDLVSDAYVLFWIDHKLITFHKIIHHEFNFRLKNFFIIGCFWKFVEVNELISDQLKFISVLNMKDLALFYIEMKSFPFENTFYLVNC